MSTNPLGTTRSRRGPGHALITPDSHVWAALPGWRGATAAIHISPLMGARFTQTTVVLEAEGTSGPPTQDVERFVFPLEGRLRLTIADASPLVLEPGDFPYLPPVLAGARELVQ